ncbi:MAG: choice-of-anchor J domain-containing protein [Flavobacteriales bacterium]|nr:choice-of-anchor J domain-containing protein [Flavobacteriales bacterium]
MKKITITLLLVLYSVVGFSQVFFESFENTTGPDAAPSTNWTLGSGNWAVFDTNIGGTVNWSINSNSYNGAKAAFMNRQNIAPGITTEEYLVTPLLTIPSNGELNFYARTFTNGNQGTLYQVKIASAGSNPTNPSDYTLLAEFDENQLSTYFANYEERIIDLSAFAGTQVYIAFVQKHLQQTGSISGDRWFLDDVLVQSHPTCSKPINLITSDITTTSATLDWTDTSGASSWEVIAYQTGTTALTPNSVGIITNSHPFTFQNLNPYTPYSFSVRALCSSTEISNWATIASFVTSQLCPSPSDIEIADIGLTNATINWLENGSATSWEIVALPYGTDLTSATTGVVTSSNPYTLNNLVQDTLYRVYIRSLCSATESSLWESSLLFSTTLPPTECGGYFVDNGGSYQNYLNLSNYTYTICPSNANEVVTVTFTEFKTENNFDGMYIYDGNSIAQSAILSGNGPGSEFGPLTNPGAFWGDLNANLPGPFTSSSADGCLTFSFLSDGSVTSSGWKASVSCGSPDRINLVAFIDANGNGIKDNNESNFTYGSFVYDENDSGNPTSVYSPYGYYTIHDIVGGTNFDFSYDIQTEYQSYYGLGSVSNYNNITTPVGSGPQTLYFPINLIQSYTDLSIVGNQNPANAGQLSPFYIKCRNNGLSSTNGTITYTKPTQTTINYIYPAGATLNATGFTYSFSNLLPNQSINIVVYLSVPPIPTVAIGDFLTSTISVTSSVSEVNLTNNNFVENQVITASYDPNDKVESHGGTIEFADFTEDDYLYYTIRFENTGTASASNIRIEDELDAKLDETSVRMVSTSHNYVLNRQSNHLTWNFNTIQLPVSDYPNSTIGQGYILFKVKPKPGYAVGDIIPNSASIYFDTNPAIITNTFNTEFVDTLGNPRFDSNNVFLAPNPTNETFQIQLQNTSETIKSITITDVLGKTIHTLKATTGNQMSVDVANLSRGVYFVEIITQNGLKQTKKLIKE